MHRLLPLSLVLGLAPVALAQRVPEIEPNDTAAQAQTVLFGQHVAANLVAGEQDWFNFVVLTPSEVHVQTSGNNNVSSSVDTAVFLFDATGTTQLAWNDNNRGSQSDCGVNLQPGTYTALVLGKTATVAGDYGLDLVALPAAVIATGEGAEPNDDPALGGTPTPFVPGTVFSGNIASTSDVDWFTFTLANPAVVQAMVLDDDGVPQLDRTKLSMYQQTAPGVWTAIGTVSTSSLSHRITTYQHPQILQAGSYAYAVASGGVTGTAPFAYAAVGNYAVRTRLLDMPGTSVVAEAPEPNDTIATGTLMQLGDSATGNITPQDVDWFVVGVTGPTVIAVMSDNGTPSPITDTTVTVRTFEGTTVASGTSGGPTSHGRVITNLNTPGLYSIEVRGGTITAQGDYRLYLGGAAALSVPSTFNQQPPSTNACPGSNGLRPALVNPNSEVPMLGSTFVVRLQNCLPNNIAAPFLGFSNTVGSAAALPIDLGPIGAGGCFLRVDPVWAFGIATDAAGVAFIALPVPADLALRGVTLYMQSMQFDAANNQLGISMTNDVRFVLGDRGF